MNYRRIRDRAAISTVLIAAGMIAGTLGTVRADPPATSAQTAVRRIVMKDARSATQFAEQLKTMQATGVFGGVPSTNPAKPTLGDLAILASGNYLVIAGDRDRLDKYIGPMELMAFLYERPRAHLQLNARVVQLTGPANTDVIQMTETVRALVDAQRTEVVSAFADLQEYLLERLKRRKGTDLAVYQEIRRLLPTLGDGSRPLTVPEILLLLMVDRALPDLPPDINGVSAGSDADQVMLAFQKALSEALRDPHESDEQITEEITASLTDWEKAVTAARSWCIEAAHGSPGRGWTPENFLSAIRDPRCPLPTWVALHLQRSVELTARLYPSICHRHAEEALSELEHRFQLALDRERFIRQSIAAIQAPPKKGAKEIKRLPGDLRRRLFDLQSVANDLVSVPAALFQSIAAETHDASPDLNQLIAMFHAYADERTLVDSSIHSSDAKNPPSVNYAKLEMLESGINLWLRRASEAMSRTLETQFYNHYVDQLRLLANRQLGKVSSKDVLSESTIEKVPDVVQDILLSDSTVNLFVSNSVSLQFEPDTTGSVAATVATRLPQQLGLVDRLNQAAQASAALNQIAQNSQYMAPGATALASPTGATSTFSQLASQYGLDGTSVIQALFAGGQSVSAQSGINLTATPSIGFDATTVTLTLTVNETLQPNTDNITDRVTNHSINDATVTALAYEPTVLSTLTSNLSYYQTTGGFPMLRQIPGLKNLLADIPMQPFQMIKRSKGIYQSSLIILEPVVIPTIEDVVRFFSGWRN